MTKTPKRTVTRATLIQDLRYRCDALTLISAEKVVDHFFQEITTALIQDKIVTLRRFGLFKPKVRSARMARNPKTNQKVRIAPKKLASFKVSNIFLKELNQGQKI
jgi:integration host factor subunit beta